MDTEFLPGVMEIDLRDSFKTMPSMAPDLSSGLMENGMWDSGVMARETGLALSMMQKEWNLKNFIGLVPQ